MRPARDPVERFMSHVRVSNSGCHEWQSKIDKGGYGHFTLAVGSHMRAHRYAWLIFNGEIPCGMWVLHKCDNRRCVNPDHLFLGTAGDNARDMVAKGRNWGYRKVDDFKAIEILSLLKSGLTQQQTAKSVGVNQTTVSKVKRGVTDYAANLIQGEISHGLHH